MSNSKFLRRLTGGLVLGATGGSMVFAAEGSGAPAMQLAWMGAVVLLALCVCCFALLRGYRSFGIVAGSLVLGSAGRLAMMRDLWFPAVDPFPLNVAVALGTLALAIQGLTAIIVLWQNRQSVLASFGDLSVPLRFVIVIGAMTVLSLSPTVHVAYGGLSSYLMQAVLGGAVATVSLLSLGALLIVPGPSLPRMPQIFSPLLAMLVAFGGAAALAVFAFEGLPHVGDDLTYLFQSQTFLAGQTWAPAPPMELRAGLEYYLLDVQGERWFGTTPPGWPLLLMLGQVAGVPWIVNPILTALSVGLAYRLIRKASGDPLLAGVSAWLMACSPWVLGTGGSLMTHTTALFALLLAWLCLIEGGALRDGTKGQLATGWALIGGLAMGWLFTTRPFEGLVLGVLTGIALLTLRPIKWASIVAYGAGCITTGLLFLLHNISLTGHPLKAPLAVYLKEIWPDRSNAFGFGLDRGPEPGAWSALDYAPGHSLTEGLVNTANGLASTNLEALGWGTGSVLAVALLLWRRGPLKAGGGFLTLCFVAVVALMVFYWFSGTFYIGPRYWYIVALPIFVAAGSGILALMRRLPEAYGSRVPTLVVLMCLIALVVFTPWRGINKYYQFRGNYSWLAGEDFTNDLVFVSFDSDAGDMQAVLALNNPFLPADKPIFLRDLGPEANAAAASVYPERGSRLVRLGPQGWDPVE